MSHFAVAVFHREDQDIADLLAPYNENMEVEPYVRFTKEQAIEYARLYIKEEDGATDEELWEMAKQDYPNSDEEGNLYSTYNPDSKWDWYSIGGRFFDVLNGRCDDWIDPSCSAKVKNIDFSQDREEYEFALKFWDDVMSGKDRFYNPEYFEERYSSGDEYAKRSSLFTTRAVVTPDGVWHEKGEMGWFGMSSETPEESKDWDDHYYERFIKTADPEWILTIVDCHI